VLNDSRAVDDENGASGGVSDAGEAFEQHVVGVGGFLVQIGYQREGDVFLFGPSFLGEWAVYTDSNDLCVEAFVVGHSCGEGAEFVGADAGEGERNEYENHIGFADVISESEIFEACRRFCFQGEEGSLGAGLDCHSFSD